MATKHHKLIPTATKVCDALTPLASGKLPQEILVLNPDTVAIIAEIDGVDYVLSMHQVPQQRPRPTSQ
jgi:hypothetical protein